MSESKSMLKPKEAKRLVSLVKSLESKRLLFGPLSEDVITAREKIISLFVKCAADGSWSDANLAVDSLKSLNAGPELKDLVDGRYTRNGMALVVPPSVSMLARRAMKRTELSRSTIDIVEEISRAVSEINDRISKQDAATRHSNCLRVR